jgi:hypothetical protein
MNEFHPTPRTTGSEQTPYGEEKAPTHPVSRVGAPSTADIAATVSSSYPK